MISFKQYRAAFEFWMTASAHRRQPGDYKLVEAALETVALTLLAAGSRDDLHDPDSLCDLMERTDRIEDRVRRQLRMEIRKSCLLARLIYAGEQPRTRPCPLHEGKWSGCSPDPCPHGCSFGSNLTGWLP